MTLYPIIGTIRATDCAVNDGGQWHSIDYRGVDTDIRGDVYVRRIGRPTAPLKLLLLHGVGLTHATWGAVLPALAELADCAAVDLLGHGRSHAARGFPVTMAAQTTLVPAVLDALGWPSAVLVGHSMGGGAALGAALCWPRRVRGLVLVASVAYPQPIPPGFFPLYLPGAPLVIALACRLAGRLGGDWLAGMCGYDRLAARDYFACLADPYQARSVVRAVTDLRPSEYRRYSGFYPQIGVPALIVHGRHDFIVPPFVAERLHLALADSELVWIEHGQHMPQESQAGPLTAAVAGFLTRRFGAAR